MSQTNDNFDALWARVKVTTVLHISRDTDTSEEGWLDEESKLLDEAWDALEKLGFIVSEPSTSIDFK